MGLLHSSELKITKYYLLLLTELIFHHPLVVLACRTQTHRKFGGKFQMRQVISRCNQSPSSIMKVCSLKRLLKYSILISSTSFITTVVFHFVRQPHRGHSQADKNLEYEGVNRAGRSRRIDWHNEALIESENQRRGWC